MLAEKLALQPLELQGLLQGLVDRGVLGLDDAEQDSPAEATLILSGRKGRPVPEVTFIGAEEVEDEPESTITQAPVGRTERLLDQDELARVARGEPSGPRRVEPETVMASRAALRAKAVTESGRGRGRRPEPATALELPAVEDLPTAPERQSELIDARPPRPDPPPPPAPPRAARPKPPPEPVKPRPSAPAKKTRTTESPRTVPPRLGIEDVDAQGALQVALQMEQGGRQEEAVAYLERAIARSPDAAPLYNRLAVILMRDFEEFERAEQLMLQALKLAVGHPVFTRNLNTVRQRIRDARRGQRR
jgi:hypothetical protein